VGALGAALDVDGVDLGESVCPILHSDEATQSRLVIPEADEGGHHNQGGLEHRERVAHGAHELDRSPSGCASM
jgi:hypothetical protein